MRKRVTDSEIIIAINAQDKRQVRERISFLYQDCFPTVRRFIIDNSGTDPEAADMFQEALVIFYLKVRKGEYKNLGTIRSYLYGIVKNLWLKELRKRKKTPNKGFLTKQVSYELELSIYESHITLRELLEQVGGQCKRLLLDFYFEKLSIKELTKKYGLGSDGATKNKKYRCLQKLVKLVSKNKLKRTDFKGE